MKISLAVALCSFALLAGCGGGGGNNSANQANVAAQEGDLNAAISGDELSPIPEAADDMAANQSAAGNAAGNTAQPAPPAGPAPAPAPQPR